MEAGIYKLSWPSGHYYIGRSHYINQRFKQHLYKMRSQNHPIEKANALFKELGPPNLTILKLSGDKSTRWEVVAERKEILNALKTSPEFCINRYTGAISQALEDRQYKAIKTNKQKDKIKTPRIENIKLDISFLSKGQFRAIKQKYGGIEEAFEFLLSTL